MTLPEPNLDDRTWSQLVAEAVDLVQRRGGPWRADSVHDPGVTLIEAFAHLTDILLYRLNRVPEKLHVRFLNVMGASRRSPVAASVVLRFERRASDTGPIAIPRGTRVATSGTGPRVFSTLHDVVLGTDSDHVTVPAVDGTLVDGVVLGVATGRPGLELTVPGAPVPVAPAGADLQVAVEAAPGGPSHRLVEGRPFELWEERDGFAGIDPDEPSFVVDRAAGRVAFAPAADLDGASALARVPPAGAEVRAWYCDGGGDAGNVAAGTLIVLKDQIAGVTVTNPEAATGGRDIEPVDQALARAAHHLQARGRAVTARDYEQLAIGAAGGVSRARAFTRRDVWSFAPPGEVEVVLVPHVPAAERPGGRVGLDTLLARQTEEARARVQRVLDERRPLGVHCVVQWCNYKAVSISADVVLHPGADRATVEAAVRQRIDELLSPLPSDLQPRGRPFGGALRASNVYRATEVPGVRHIEHLVFRLDEVPEGVVSQVAWDHVQPDTFFAASGGVLYRTLNATRGWEPCGRFPGEEIVAVVPHPALAPGHSGLRDRPGHVAVVTVAGERSRAYVTRDLGERWDRIADLGFIATGVAWAERGDRPLLLVSSRAGLHELVPEAGAVPVQSLVVAGSPDLGLRAVEAFGTVRGQLGVAVVADTGGVHLSTDGGRSGTFEPLGAAGDVRALAVQQDGPATWLWIGVAAPDEPERGGCGRIRLDDLASGWNWFTAGWNGGTARALAVAGDRAYAATQSGGVLRLTLAGDGRWQAVEVSSGIPLRDRARFTPVRDLAVDAASGLIVVGSEQGVLRSVDGGDRYEPAAERQVTDQVALPPTWLFCAGQHDLRVGERDAG